MTVQYCDIKGCTNEACNKFNKELKDDKGNEFFVEVFICNEHFHAVEGS